MEYSEHQAQQMAKNPPDNNTSIAQPSTLAEPGTLTGLKSSAESKANARTSTAGGLRTPASQGTPSDPVDAGGADSA